MKIVRYSVAVLGMILCLEGCAAPVESSRQPETILTSDMNNTSQEENISDETSSAESIVPEEKQDAPAKTSQIPDISNTSQSESISAETSSAESIAPEKTQDVPETSEPFSGINSENYYFDRNVCRFVADKDGNILEPENDNEPPLKYVYEMADSEYIGTGELLGTRPDAKLYLMSDGNILSVFPCDIEPYSDAEEMLSKYSRDMIFEACCFIRSDG